MERKKTLIVFSVVFFVSFILGIALIGTPAAYDYHLNACDRFIDRICFSQNSVILIFFERAAGNALLLAAFCISGIHIACLVLPPALLVYRAYTCGGSVAIFFSVYGVTGILIALVLYLPVHLLIDGCCISATALSFGRARGFRFCKTDFIGLFFDYLILLLMVIAICLLEMILLLVLFHPLGNIL